MAWSITRRATDEDVELLEKRAKAFINRHELDGKYWREYWPISTDSDAIDLELGLQDAIQHGDEVEQLEGKRLLRLWKRICNRAIGDDGIDHGHIGHSVE